MTSTLTLDTVTVSFPRPGQADLTVLNAFDLTVNPGEFHVLAGRSGSGKTTALRVAAHLLQPTTGHVRWGDTNPATLTRDALADLRRTWVAYVDQDAHVLDGLRALDNVLLPLIPSGITNTHRQHALHLLDQLGLTGQEHGKTGTMSGGERQRITVARALISNAQAIVLDEPTASLDETSAHHVITLLRHAANQGTGVLAASHDPAVLNAADHIHHLEHRTRAKHPPHSHRVP